MIFSPDGNGNPTHFWRGLKCTAGIAISENAGTIRSKKEIIFSIPD
jgi:hypothetical protein